MTGRVFVCHASQDAGMAQRAVAVLEAAGVRCWIAPRNIDPGETYTQAILDALEATPAVVLVFSAATNESPHVQRELETAVGAGHPIVPIRVEAVEPSRSLRYFIGTSQWLEASGQRTDVWSPALVRAVRRAVGFAVDTVAIDRIRTPQPGSFVAEPANEAMAPVPRAGGRRRAVLVGAGVVALVAVAVVVTLLVAGRDGTPVQADADAGGKAAAHSSPVTCWNDSAAADAAHCPVPTGRAGMATVFPGLTADCTQVESPIEGKAEVYECVHDGFLVRYTRWDAGYDKESYYSVENQVASQAWKVQGEAAGLQWTSIDTDPEETQRYQWSAAYAGHPFSVSVEGDTAADRSSGVASLEVALPDHIGLP